MAWLPDGEQILMICLFVLTQLTNVIDGQTDRHCMTTSRTCNSIARQKSSDIHEILYTAADFELHERHVIKNEIVALDRLRVRQNVGYLLFYLYLFITYCYYLYLC